MAIRPTRVAAPAACEPDPVSAYVRVWLWARSPRLLIVSIVPSDRVAYHVI